MLTRSLHSAAEFMSGRGVALVLIAAILCGSAVGLAFPHAGQMLSGQIDYTILLLVFLLLFEIRFQSILYSLNRLSFIAVALVANFLIIPALGFAIASIFLSAHPLFFIGLLIYFMAPCTDWFLGFTRLANGNTALGAALLPINMLIQLLLFPVYLNIFGIDAVGTGTAGDISQTLGQWFLIPLFMALALRFLAERLLREDQLDFVQSAVSVVVPLLLAVLVWQISAANIATLMSHVAVVPLILFAIFLFFMLTFLLSEMISRAMNLAYEDRVLITMTTAARNAPLMLALAMVVMPDQPVIYAAIIIGMLVELPHLVALKFILMRRRAFAALDRALPGGEPSSR
ncbi:MAG: bile acid:sodium symporter [Pseudomonadota bacterium]